MKDIGKTIREMERENTLIQMEMSMKATGKMMKKKAMACINSQMEIIMKESFKKAKNKVKENTFFKMVLKCLVHFQTTNLLIDSSKLICIEII